MASVTRRPNGGHWIIFRASGRQFTLRLGKCSASAAGEAKRHVEHILSARLSGEPVPGPTARWIRDLSPLIRDRAARCGLLSGGSGRRIETLGQLAEWVMDEYAGRKPNTVRNMRTVVNAMCEHLGAGRRLESITLGDGEDLRRALRRSGLAETTTSEIVRKARTVLGMAEDHEWIDRNPWSKMKGFTRSNPSRLSFIDLATTERVLRHCEPEWQLIVALVRFGGLRCPSEVNTLRWEHVNWEEGRFTVFAPKKEHMPEQAYRVTPIFWELEPYLQAAWDRAPDGAEWVVDGYRDHTGTALRSGMLKRLRRAGVEPWPKLWQNLRASRETELADRHPVHIVAKWLGNSPSIAAAHYLQATDSHFQAARNPNAKANAFCADNSAKKRDKCPLDP